MELGRLRHQRDAVRGTSLELVQLLDDLGDDSGVELLGVLGSEAGTYHWCDSVMIMKVGRYPYIPT